MKSPPFRTPYPRPSTLSDPGNDWTEEDVEAILSTPNHALTWREFRALFAVGLPIGEYTESVYYLPLALEYIFHRKNEFFEFFSEVISFISEHAIRLEADQLLEPSLGVLRECFDSWTSEFIVKHYDRDACKAMGWGLLYEDLVENSGEVTELMEELVFYKTHAAVADTLFRSLADRRGDPIKSAWFLECVREMRSGMCKNVLKKRNAIHSTINEQPALQYHAQIVLDHMVASEPSPTYWNDTFTMLGV